MAEQPAINTGRLILRPWTMADAEDLHRLAGHREIADTMISVPHPFSLDHACNWISSHALSFEQGEAVHFAIELNASRSLAGAVELRAISREHCHGELSLWIAPDFWGQGFATGSAIAVIRHGFEQLGLNRIQAFHMVRNPGSGRVLEKIGMRREGVLRQLVRKWGQFEDVVLMAILREDWIAKC